MDAKIRALGIVKSLRCEDLSDIMGRPYFAVLRNGGRVGDWGTCEETAWEAALRHLDPRFSWATSWRSASNSAASS